jgi:hypothetical protein
VSTPQVIQFHQEIRDNRLEAVKFDPLERFHSLLLATMLGYPQLCGSD